MSHLMLFFSPLSLICIDTQLGQGLPLHWTLKNLANDVLMLKVLVTEGDGGQQQQQQQAPTDDSLVWGGMRESVVQILPHASIIVPYEVVPLATGPVALPRLNLTILSSAAGGVGGGGKEEPAPARVSYRYLENAPSAAAAAAAPPTQTMSGDALNKNSSLRHVFVLPAEECCYYNPPTMR